MGHPFSRLICHDGFVTDPLLSWIDFRGPGKYDGSVVNCATDCGQRHLPTGTAEGCNGTLGTEAAPTGAAGPKAERGAKT